MAKTVSIKIPSDIEFRVIGNAFGLLIASAGLLGGTMISQRSFDYWLDDIVPLMFVSWMIFRLYRNLLSTMAAYPDLPAPETTESSAALQVNSEPVIVGQITSKPAPTPEQVVEEVARRIESQREAAAKKNKFNN
ncbi:MAG: hypothetical protein PHD54_15420 [Desulfuromonadaceae bacterium]|nr:hypothetical protein [Desulfuromonadaceae bacterium]